MRHGWHRVPLRAMGAVDDLLSRYGSTAPKTSVAGLHDVGIIVTTAAAVSGLEFDAVVVPDLSASFYPSDDLRRALYVVATRARDWLWLLTPDRWSPLVQQ